MRLLTEEIRHRLRQRDSTGDMAKERKLIAEVARLSKALTQLRSDLDVHSREHAALIHEVITTESAPHPQYIQASNTRRWHLTNTPQLYCTAGCDWAYRQSPHSVHDPLSAGPASSSHFRSSDTICFRCFPEFA